MRASVSIIGAGIFGVTAALELDRRGHRVTLLDPGPVPHPDASSTDTSKAVRMDYGRDAFFMDFAAAALDGWRGWNREWGETLFHEVGILMLTPAGIGPGSFEAESLRLLHQRGVPAERMDAVSLAERFPAWAGAGYAEGYFNPLAGWAESGKVVARLAHQARAAGIPIREGTRCTRLHQQGSRVTGIELDGGEAIASDHVIVATGAWTPSFLPHLSAFMWATGQPVAYLAPVERDLFDGERFPVWCADIGNTGWYGFPVTREGLLKIGNHGPGRRMGAQEAREVTAEDLARASRFAARSFPGLVDPTVVRSRLCLYCDTWDGDFLIDHDPERPGLMVASGGSGHGFKFAPLLGKLIADVLEHEPNPYAQRFRWRSPGARRTEHARYGNAT